MQYNGKAVHRCHVMGKSPPDKRQVHRYFAYSIKTYIDRESGRHVPLCASFAEIGTTNVEWFYEYDEMNEKKYELECA